MKNNLMNWFKKNL